MGKTSIEWTRGDDGSAGATWNPVRGCSRISPGCGGPNHQGGCYAEKIAARFSGPGQPFEGFAERGAYGGRWTGKMALVDEMLTLPLRWKKPRRIFVNSMSDLFHENLPDEAIDKVFAVMALAPQHTFQVLTKRADRMRAYFDGCDLQKDLMDFTRPWHGLTHWQRREGIRGAIEELIERGFRYQRTRTLPLPNLWLGVSAEDQEHADERVPDLLETPAAKRFVSAEPLLGPLCLRDIHDGVDSLGRRSGNRLDWVIVGGESGPRSRPMHPDWARSLRDQCHAAGVPFFFKQWGEWIGVPDLRRLPNGGGPGFGGFDHCQYDQEHEAVRIGKKAAGAMLDGCEHREFPT